MQSAAAPHRRDEEESKKTRHSERIHGGVQRASGTERTCAAIEQLGFRCRPLTERNRLSAPFREAVPNEEARRLLASWAVFPQSQEPALVRHSEVPIDGVLDVQTSLMGGARSAAESVGAEHAVVRVPLLGLFVQV